ncbi:Hypothetical predicted protein [Mytilus galloprovincialis]|uniref:Uncharacterized protein n=1 Tax=Mytilus galloprovincialis TaxID=29158 RepID=A0A8B6HPB6_MYTGA|nr:Hypothetical predicted protein [Mytilus galloprovincialis]
MYDRTTLLLDICGFIALCSGVSAADIDGDGYDTADNTIPVVVISILSVLILISLVLLCAGDSNVQHNDAGNTQRKSITSPEKKKNNAFQEIELSKPRKINNAQITSAHNDIPKKSSNLQPKGNDWPPLNDRKGSLEHRSNNTTDITHAKQEASILVVEDSTNKASTSYHNENVNSELRFSGGRFQDAQPNIQTRTRSTSETPDSHIGSMNSNNSSSQRERINTINRQNREDTADDIGYHSDFSRSIKPDTESNPLSTFRSSQPQSNPRSATTGYGVDDDDVIETYQDDGESIDWD